MDVFEKLLEENDFVRKQRAIGEAQGHAQGKTDGEVRASQQILLDILQARYPTLVAYVKPSVERTKQIDKLREAIRLIVNASNEEAARSALDGLLA